MENENAKNVKHSKLCLEFQKESRKETGVGAARNFCRETEQKVGSHYRCFR